MSQMPLPKLLREVRKAISREDYQQAETCYVKILELPEMSDDLDAKLRYAYCAEKNGNFAQAIDTYSEVLDLYRQNGEEGAAISLQDIIEAIKTGPHAGSKASNSEPLLEEEVQPLDDATLMQQLCDMGELITLAPGDVLCREGDMPDTLWLLRSGSLTVYMPDYDEPDDIHVKEGHLALVGEVGFFTNQRRSATVVATTMAEFFAINSLVIYNRKQTDPAFKAAMLRLLFERWAEPVLTRHSVFERVNDIDRQRLMNTFKRVTLGPGETLIEAGEMHNGTYMLQSGCMFFMHAKDQRDDSTETDDGSLMTSLFPGDMIHLGGLLKNFSSHYRVVTATPVKLLHLSQETFEPFALRRPWIIQAILRFSRRPASLQVMKPEDDYLWKTDRHVKTY